MVQEGTIGRVRHIEASYLQSWLVSKAWGDWAKEAQWLWRLSRKHGSNGVLGDVGIHILDFASYGSGADVDRIFTRLKTFDKAPENRIGDYDLDANDSFAMTVEFFQRRHGRGAFQPMGDGASQRVAPEAAWRSRCAGGDPHAAGSTLKGCLGEDIETGTWRDIDAGTVPTNYQRFVDAVTTGEKQEPDFRRAANLQRVLDLSFATETERREMKV